jgi:hypothetical protein
LGKEKESVQTVSLQVYNRNAFPPGDAAALAAFVSPGSPEILEYAKRVTGLARSRLRTGLNRNMQAAVWLFEGLRAAGVRLDGTHTAEGEAQFPAETLGFRTGNRTDIGLLYAAALEASGIPAALVPLDGAAGSPDLVIACYLDVDQAGAELLFSSLDRVLVLDGEAWLPLSMNAFNGGFIAAWDGGAEALNGFFAGGGEADFIALENAWGFYPPAPLPAQGVRFREGELAGIADGVIRQYIGRDIEPLVQGVRQRIVAAREAGPDAEDLSLAGLYNRLGILLVRSGRAADGKAAWEQAASMGSVPAMTNRGNLGLIERDYAAAELWFRQALAREPDNAAAKQGLEKIEERGE